MLTKLMNEYDSIKGKIIQCKPKSNTGMRISETENYHTNTGPQRWWNGAAF